VSLRRRLLAGLARRPALAAWGLLAPGGTWLLVFFALPMMLMLGVSLMPRGTYGGVESGFTLEHYRRFLDPVYLQVLWRTVLWAAITTAICLLAGYPLAWAIAASRKRRAFLLFLVVLPFWTSFLVRTFAMIFLLRDTGLINSTLQGWGLIDQPLDLSPMAEFQNVFCPAALLGTHRRLQRRLRSELAHQFLRVGEAGPAGDEEMVHRVAVTRGELPPCARTGSTSHQPCDHSLRSASGLCDQLILS